MTALAITRQVQWQLMQLLRTSNTDSPWLFLTALLSLWIILSDEKVVRLIRLAPTPLWWHTETRQGTWATWCWDKARHVRAKAWWCWDKARYMSWDKERARAAWCWNKRLHHARSTLTRSTHMRSTLTESTLTKSTFHEINFTRSTLTESNLRSHWVQQRYSILYTDVETTSLIKELRLLHAGTVSTYM